MKVNKLLFIGLACTMILCPFSTRILASNNNIELDSIVNEKSLEIAENLSISMNYGNIVARNSLLVGENVIDLYVEFENESEALRLFVEENLIIVDYLKMHYNLNEISIDNFDEYYANFIALLDEDYPSFISEDCVMNFRKFYDIFENKSLNEEIINKVNSIGISEISSFSTFNENGFNEQMLDLAILVPAYSDLALQANDYILEKKSNEVSTFTLTGTSLTKARTYANNFSEDPNEAGYDYISGKDCANFASQILEETGKAQEVTSSESTGWWHTYKLSGRVMVHSHSISWIRADSFAKYMGITYAPDDGDSIKNEPFVDIKTLSQNVKAGDFIAEDSGKDGNYDHIGFVTYKNTAIQTYVDENGTSRNYINFKVAQHSDNYHEYLSSSDNNWEKMDVKGTSVVIVGR